MQTPHQYQIRLVGLSLGVFLALLIWPATRWIVQSQMALCSPTAASAAPWSNVAGPNLQVASELANLRLQETAARHPEEFPMQFAAALVVPPAGGSLTSETKVKRLRALVERFPDRPTLYAAILRFATQNQVRIERDEERILTGEPGGRSQQGMRKAPNTPEQLALFDRDAAAGERLDPDNAHFPLVRAIGLFAAHRDTEALAAIARAAQKSNWTEYYADEVDAEWKLQEATFGTVSALPRMGYAAGLLLPHYGQLRAASRVAIVKAIDAELAGRTEEGLRIRNSVRTCGSLMRIQSVCVLGGMVGVGISQTSLLRPGGAPPIPQTHDTMDAQVRERRGRAYDLYLQRIGHADEIAGVDAETAAGVQARAIAKFAGHSPSFDYPWNLTLSWIAAALLLSTTLWMLVLGGGAILLAKHPRIRTGLGLPPATRAGVALGLCAGPLAAGATLLHPALFVSILLLAGILILSLLLMALPGAKGPARLNRLGAFGLSLLGMALLCAAVVWQMGGSIEPIVRFLTLAQDIGVPLRVPPLYVVSVGIVTLVPFLTPLTLALLSRMWGVPLSVGVTRGLRGCAVPIACLLLLAYSLLVPFTLRQESALNERLERTVQHEGRFMAEMTGKQWPGTP
ncbi:MAG: hypothetical protein JWL77_6103 [Chthonomonadaceae bacterium]|nr:hypothetical protein [Chthonomonadaceae bacterium]